MAEEIDLADATHELHNWGRCYNDGFLRYHLLHTPPPTSEHYRAPVVAYDDPDPADLPIDMLAAARTEEIIRMIGAESPDSWRALVHWFTHLMPKRRDINNAAAIKKLSKHMRCSYQAADRMLNDGIARYHQKRFTNAQKRSSFLGGP